MSDDTRATTDGQQPEDLAPRPADAAADEASVTGGALDLNDLYIFRKPTTQAASDVENVLRPS
jgi:hypothetical protein